MMLYLSWRPIFTSCLVLTCCAMSAIADIEKRDAEPLVTAISAKDSEETSGESRLDTDSAHEKSETSPVTNGEGFDCQGAPWVLGEAGRARGATVTFNPDWQPTLAKIASCRDFMVENSRCLRLQGHYDSHVFSSDIVRVFGTQEAAQNTRARSRAQTVASHLEALGFPVELLKRRAPPAKSSFRGVLVDYQADCFSAKALQAGSVSPSVLPEGEAVAIVEESVVIESPTPPAVSERAENVAPSTVNSGGIWVQLDSGGIYLDEGSGVLSLQTSVNLGWSYMGAYVKILGTVSGSAEELQRSGYGGQAGFGAHTRWTDIGVFGGLRNHARRTSDPVGDKLAFLGFDAQQCVAKFGDLWFCVREAFAPLTRLQRELDLENGQLVRINRVTTQPVQAEFAISLRYDFGDAK